MESYAKIPHMEFIEVGFGSDVERAREVFGSQEVVGLSLRKLRCSRLQADGFQDSRASIQPQFSETIHCGISG